MTETLSLVIGLTGLAYLWGSIPSAVLVCRMFDMPDPRRQGSGNPGTTNVLRIGNKQAALFTLISDVGKGFLALLPCIVLNLSDELRALCCLAAVAGHIFPIFLSLKGGKGVATTLGACIGLYWPLALLQLIAWGLVAFFGRISSLAAISTAFISPIITALIKPDYLLVICMISALLIFSHRGNISNLLTGTEPRL